MLPAPPDEWCEINLKSIANEIVIKLKTSYEARLYEKMTV